MKNKYVLINWDSKELIKKAENQKKKLENEGYNLIKTVSNVFSNISYLHYQKN